MKLLIHSLKEDNTSRNAMKLLIIINNSNLIQQSPHGQALQKIK